MYSISELRAKDREELLKLISELKGKLLALRFEAATGQLTETHLPSATKKDIAKIFTVLKEKELGIVHPGESLHEDSSAQVVIEETETVTEAPASETPTNETPAQSEEVKETPSEEEAK